MKQIDFYNVSLSGFWKNRQDINKSVTVPAVYDRFSETGRFEALKCRWKEGMPNKPHIFWDSDAAKWIESVAYILRKTPDEKLEAEADAAIDDYCANQWDDGYCNSYFTAVEPEMRFKVRDWHELYCAGHMAEAAVAYFEATGKDKLLKTVEKYMDYINLRFFVEDSAEFSTPGHEEIELALIKLYRCTGKEKYLDMCRRFIEARGTSKKDLKGKRDWVDNYYCQSDKPVRELGEAKGHSVRAMYLYCGMADLALETGDKSLYDACRTLFDSAVNRRMYVTGGIGSASHGEQFGNDYFLPNDTAYSETCASIALALFARRMSLIEADSVYADAAERAIYNCCLAGVSLKGNSFFYVNPLEINISRFNSYKEYCNRNEHLLTQRAEVFDCSCCPPNLTRFIASIGDFLYSADDSTLYIHQYAASETEYNGIKITQDTRYPLHGDVRITVKGMKGRKIALRIPGWCSFASLDGSPVTDTVKGYVYRDVAGDEQVFDLYLEMKPRLVAANPLVDADCGRVCLCRGPLVYCAESALNGGVLLNTLSIKTPLEAGTEYDESIYGYKITAKCLEDEPFDPLYKDYDAAAKEREITFLPYYAFANSGESDMLVWFRR